MSEERTATTSRPMQSEAGRVHAIILAGGAGTRLRPLTYARRKELVPLLNRPLLEYRLKNLRDNGVLDIVFACRGGAEEIEAQFGDGSALGVRIKYVYEAEPLGSGRAVKEAARAAGARGTLVVCNGDILTNLDLRGMLARHRECGAVVSISLASVEEPWHFGVADTDARLAIRRFVEKPPAGQEPGKLINAGTWLWEQDVLDRIADDESAACDGYSERVLFPSLIADGLHVQGFMEDMWFDVGTPGRYMMATQRLLERGAAASKSNVLLAQDSEVAAGVSFSGLVFVGAGARIEPGATIIGPTVIGEETYVDAGATVISSVLWDDVCVGQNAFVRRSIVASGAEVGEWARVDDAILADRARVNDGHWATRRLRLAPGQVSGARCSRRLQASALAAARSLVTVP